MRFISPMVSISTREAQETALPTACASSTTIFARMDELHRGPVVQAGDLVFFDNTWDYNGDGRINDPLTHVGIVEAVETDGTIVFISRVAGAIERYRMNVTHPHVHRTADGRRAERLSAPQTLAGRRSRRPISRASYLLSSARG